MPRMSDDTSDETISEATTLQEEVPIIWHTELMLSIYRLTPCVEEHCIMHDAA